MKQISRLIHRLLIVFINIALVSAIKGAWQFILILATAVNLFQQNYVGRVKRRNAEFDNM